MNLQEIIETLELQVLTTPKEFDQIDSSQWLLC